MTEYRVTWTTLLGQPMVEQLKDRELVDYLLGTLLDAGILPKLESRIVSPWAEVTA